LLTKIIHLISTNQEKQIETNFRIKGY